MNNYNKLKKINSDEKIKLVSIFTGLISSLGHLSVNKIIKYISCLHDICTLHHKSIENKKNKSMDKNRYHPIKPSRGEIYNAVLTEGIGSELSDNHLVIIIQNRKGNIYGEKVNVIPIEGDGTKINYNYQEQLENIDLIEGLLDKNPSRIIVTDIITIDKARLQRKIGKIGDTKMKIINEKVKKQLEL